jgi:hypothetical protein
MTPAVTFTGSEVAVGLRTFRGWLKGEQPAAPLAQLMLREFIAGWRPRLIIAPPAPSTRREGQRGVLRVAR